MAGFPPPPDRRVTHANWRDYPYSLWALQNARAIHPSIDVPRGRGAVSPLRARDIGLDDLEFDTQAGRVRLADFNHALYTDAMLVLHRGELVYERYFNGQAGDTPHLLFSATKSVVGLLADLLVHEGLLHRDAPVARYVPELAASGYGDATLEQLMDMTVALDYSRTDPTVAGASDRVSTQAEYEVALGFSPVPDGYRGPASTLDALPLIGKSRDGTPHGFGFSYETPNTDALAWVLQRASGESLSKLLSTRLWSRLGMEDDAYFLCDRAGSALAALGLNAAPRDVLRLMGALAQGGTWAGREIIPAPVIARLFSGGDTRKFTARASSPQRPGYAYRGQWWLPPHPDHAIQAIGFFGQRMYVNARRELAILRLSAAPVNNESVEADHRALFAAIEDRLR